MSKPIERSAKTKQKALLTMTQLAEDRNAIEAEYGDMNSYMQRLTIEHYLEGRAFEPWQESRQKVT